MKKIVLTISLLLLFIQKGYSQWDIIWGVAKEVLNTGKEMSDTVFKNTMVANTLTTITALQDNYKESKRFYEEFKKVVDNPQAIGEDLRKQFTDETNETLSKITARANDRLQQFERDSLSSATSYLQANLDFEDSIIKSMKEQNKKIEESLNAIKSSGDDKAKIEGVKLKLETQQLISLQQTNQLLFKILESQNKKFEQETLAKQRMIQYQKRLAESAIRTLNERVKRLK